MAMKPSSKFQRMQLKPSQDMAGKAAGMVKDVVTNPLGSINKKTTGMVKDIVTNPLAKARAKSLKKMAGGK